MRYNGYKMSDSFSSALFTTEYHFDNQTDVYHGKVRDVYTLKDKYLALVATDRISAFDQILPRPIPYKGQVLNQIAEYFLKATEDVAENWLVSVPDPNVSLGYKCEPLRVEMVVRGMLVGHAWREYKAGKRLLCGEEMPDGLNEYDVFEKPIITPTTKAEAGHDEDISEEEIISSGLVEEPVYKQIKETALRLFARGQQMAAERGLFLADTKYEFGVLNGKLILIDEIHTPDSSRYFYQKSLDNYAKDKSHKPKNLSKEFVRSWLMENGFSGQAGEEVPEMTDEKINEISARYIELYEQITGKKFEKADDNVDISKRIEDNINKAIKEVN